MGLPINIEQLSYWHNTKIVLDCIDMQIAEGSIVAIMGSSGIGKTTLLKLIGGAVRPDGGQIRIGDQVVHQQNRKQLYALRRKMGILFQSAALFTHESVFENVAFPYREHTKLPERMIYDLVNMKLEAVGLRGTQSLMPSQLSGGMARRVALARALALDPAVMMYDEPFVGQDPIAVGVLQKLIRELNDVLGMTSIIVSHDVPETLAIVDYAYIIADGIIVGHGTPEEIRQSQEPHVLQFIQGKPDGVLPFHYPCTDVQEALLQC